MKKIIFVLFLYTNVLFSGEKIVEVQSDNYISRGYSEKASRELAKVDACNSARKELIAFVFGATFQINQNMIKSLGVMNYSQDVSINTGEIVLRAAMTETSLYSNVTKCTITYPIQEAMIELDRLKSAQNNKSIRFTDIGDPNNMKGGVLEIVTIPEDTDVFIDNVRWGTTPLRLYGKLNIGTHTVRLDNPNYKVVEESFEVGATSKVRINKILKRATGKLKITSDPEGATVKINEEEITQTPTQDIELLAGQKLKIEVNHPETETNIQYITLIRDESKTLNQKLLLKPGFISLNVIPSTNISIEIDGVKKTFSSSNSWIQLEAGDHQISVSSKDHAKETFNINIHGGERKAIPTIKLVTLKSIEEARIADEKYQREEQIKRDERERIAREEEEERKRNELTSVHLLLGFEGNYKVPKYGDPSYGFLLGVQKSIIYNYVGIQLSGSFGSEAKDEKSNNFTPEVGKPNSKAVVSEAYTYQTILLSLPIYLGSFYLNPGYGIRFDQTTEKIYTYKYNGTSTGSPVEKKVKTKTKFNSFVVGFIFPKNDQPSYGSVYIEGGINRYQGFKEKDGTFKLGFRWNFK